MLDLTSYFNEIIESIRKQVSEQVQSVAETAYTEYFKIAEQRVKEVFQDVVSEWYDSYNPEFYERNNSMYQILETELGSDYLRIEFNSDIMTMRHDGESVYSLTFKRGFHGGAPGPRGMQYRTPYPYFTHWGRLAVSSTPPFLELQNWANEFSKGEGQAIFNELFMEGLKTININF